MNIVNKIKGLLRWYIKEFNRKEIHPIIPQITIPNLLKDKVALVFGGGGGIGKAIVNSFLNSGCHVIVVSRNAETTKSFFPKNENLVFLGFDLQNLSSIDELVQSAIAIWGKIDILVNSAGTHTENIDFWTVSEAEYDRVLDINLKGCYFVSRQIAIYMKEKGINGHILNISSSTGGEPSWSPYRISKRALEGLTLGMAQMMQPYGIVVNGIAPGEVATSLINWKEGDSIDTEHNQFGRMSMPEEVANLALFLVTQVSEVKIQYSMPSGQVGLVMPSGDCQQ